MSRPNILLIFTDQQRYDTIAALGNPLIRTPVLDRLVHEGTAFTRCYTPSPVCVSARCATLTGLPPHKSGCVDNMPMPQNQPSVMERLQTLGYQTHGIGKMHFTPDAQKLWGFDGRDRSEELATTNDDFANSVRANGYDHVDDIHGVRSEYYYIPQPSQLPSKLHHTQWVADRSIDFFERRNREQPFFLWASFIKPHPPFENPVPWNKLYRTAEMPLPFRPEGYEQALTFWNHVQNRYKYRGAGQDDLLLRTMAAAYYACISFIDQNVGRIFAALGDELDQTLVIFTADHGELLGDYGSVGKRSMLDAAARVPMLVRWPQQFPAGTIRATPTTLLDIWPTLLAAAGDPSPQIDPEGEDLRRIVAEPGQQPRFVYSQLSSGPTGLYLATDGVWKYTYSAADEREWLYNVAQDPGETHNLANSGFFATATARMRSTLIRRLHEDGYTDVLDGDQWRRYGTQTVPADPDYGLLFQDRPGLQERIDALGPYARSVTPPAGNGAQIFRAIKR